MAKKQGNKKTRVESNIGLLPQVDGEYTEEAKQRMKEAGHEVERVEELTEYGDKLMLQIIEAGYKPSEALMIAGNLIIWTISNQAKSREGARTIVSDIAVGITESLSRCSFPEEREQGGKD
jgi:hypothetical protein